MFILKTSDHFLYNNVNEEHRSQIKDKREIRKQCLFSMQPNPKAACGCTLQKYAGRNEKLFTI